MVSLTRYLKRVFPAAFKLPELSGTALIFGSAPKYRLTESVLQSATIVTTNASQATLEKHGITVPDVTVMRWNLWQEREIDEHTLKTLKNRKTRNLIIVGAAAKDAAEKTLPVLNNAGYQYDRLYNIDLFQRDKLFHKLTSGTPYMSPKRHWASGGLTAIALAVAGGSDSILVTGLSFRSTGYSYDKGNFPREHVDVDQQLLSAISARHPGIEALDREFSEDSGLPYFNQDQNPQTVASADRN